MSARSRRTAGTVAAGLRQWAADHPSTVRAAVELLIRHEAWLRRVEFVAIAVNRDPNGCYWIDWSAARHGFDAGLFARASLGERAVLDLAIALGQDRYHLGRMGTGTSRRIADAVTTATGLPPPRRRPDRAPSRSDDTTATTPFGSTSTCTTTPYHAPAAAGGSEHQS